jgi:hypothetical protein
MALSPQHLVFPAADLRFTFHASRFTVPLNSILLTLLCLAGAACSTTAPTGKILFEDARGSVSLQTISDPLIQANHPIKLEPALLAQLLTGLEIHEGGTGPHRRVESGFAGQPSTYPLFSKDQIQFLAPLLAEGLRTATVNQFVEFRVVTTKEGSNRFQSATTETTSGSLYTHGRELYVILSQYRYDPMRTNENIADLSNRSSPLDYSGLKNRTLLFTPEAALRADSPNPPTLEKTTDRFVAVDYQLLDQAWRASATKRKAGPQVGGGAATVGESPEGTQAAEADARSREALAQEVETLKQEVESMKKNLGSQNPGQDSPTQKAAPPSKQ